MRRVLALSGSILLLPACGGGVITAEDVPPGTAGVIALVVVVALLYAAYIGGSDR